MAHVGAWLDLFKALEEQDDLLQVAMKDLLRRYFLFIKSANEGTRHLRLRCQKDGAKRIRRIAWTHRIFSDEWATGRRRAWVRQLPGPFQVRWVYYFAEHWSAHAQYIDFDRERCRLNRFRFRVVGLRRRITLSLRNRWAVKADWSERERAMHLVELGSPGVASKDLEAVVGACAWARAIADAEISLGTAVEGCWRSNRERNDVPIEPHLGRQANWMLRFRWLWRAAPCFLPDGRKIQEHVAGTPTDAWMRKAGMPAAARRHVRQQIRQLAPLKVRHRELVDYLARFRREVGGLGGELAVLTAADRSDQDEWR